MRIAAKFDGQRRLMRQPTAFVFGITALVLSSPTVAQACSVCGGNTIGTDPGAGFNASLLFLLAMPYVVVGVIAGWLIYKYWRGSGHRPESTPIPYPASIEKQRWS